MPTIASFPRGLSAMSPFGPALLAVLALAAPAEAHPDVFMETRVTFVFDAHGLSAVQVELMLEKLCVRGAYLQVDMNHDGQITGQELHMFESLYHLDDGSLGDYVRLWVNGKDVTDKPVTDRSLVQKEGELGVRYTIPCKCPAASGRARPRRRRGLR